MSPECQFSDAGRRPVLTLSCSLLDPSCSGSGIVNRLDYLLEDAEVDVQEGQAARLEKLAGFQLQMILHAFKCESACLIMSARWKKSLTPSSPVSEASRVFDMLYSRRGRRAGRHAGSPVQGSSEQRLDSRPEDRSSADMAAQRTTGGDRWRQGCVPLEDALSNES